MPSEDTCIQSEFVGLCAFVLALGGLCLWHLVLQLCIKGWIVSIHDTFVGAESALYFLLLLKYHSLGKL